MIIFALVWYTVATGAWAQRCLTGHMTDVQTWVDQDGHLTINSAPANFMDLSDNVNAVTTLQSELGAPTRRKGKDVRFLSMARCHLRIVPGVFTVRDTEGRALADTVEYITMYGNQFDDHQSTGDRYDSFINATQARALASGVGYDTRATASWPGGFMGVQFKNLKQLDLRACAITTLSGSIFQGMANLEALYLSDNSILYINAKAFEGLSHLSHLDLSRNYEYDEFGITKPLIVESVDVMKDLKNLVSLDFSYTRLSQSNLMMFQNFGKKFERLSLCETGLSKLRDTFFSGTSLRYLDISGNSGILNHFNALAGIEDTLEVLYADRIALSNFDMFERFKRLEILKLSKNEIGMIKPEVAKTLKRLQVLDLDRNRVSTWFDPTFKSMKRLKYLSLKYNNINMISEEMLEDFQAAQYVGLSGNFVICNCNTREFFEHALVAEINVKVNETALESAFENKGNPFSSFHTGFTEYNKAISKRKNVSVSCAQDEYCDGKIYDNVTLGSYLLLDYDPIQYQCMQVLEGKHVSYSKVLSCNQTKRDIDYGDLIEESRNKVLAVIVIPGVLFPMLIFAYIFRRNFKYFFITLRNSALLSMINKDAVIDDSRIFNYDVFVSYCNDDRGWILDHLLPHLETDCRVSVCLHERDFQVGLSILENIVSCMDRSRTIMLIISRQFLLSQWCQFEMHLAQHRLLETRREDLILVLLEDIPRRLRPNTLHYLMLTKTYIVYPQTENEQKDFWKRLGRSVAARRPDHENDSLA
ncbi:uncharacterized protein isoform X2 [Choristoneura fumiferana]|uniref:uncharacterized protein isoform X2 n=1 Tax=Choristoneura fumiferana TaxID=7141 RepID=UPI003D154B8C